MFAFVEDLMEPRHFNIMIYFTSFAYFITLPMLILVNGTGIDDEEDDKEVDDIESKN